MNEHRYKCFLEYDERLITLDVYTTQELAGLDLLQVAINQSIDALESAGIKANPEDFAPIAYKYVGPLTHKQAAIEKFKRAAEQLHAPLSI